MPDDSKEDTDSLLHRFVNSVVIGGIAGGLAFALLAPFVMPAITSVQAQTGFLVDEPSIEADFHGGPTEFITRGNATFPKQGQEYNYTITVENNANRLAEDVRIIFYFKGCAETRGFRSTNGRLYADPDVRFESTRCAETVYLPDLAQGDEVNLRYHINATAAKHYSSNLIVIDRDRYIAYHVEYQWSLNGMTYHEAETTQVNQSELYW